MKLEEYYPKYRIWLNSESGWARGSWSTLEDAIEAKDKINDKYRPYIMERLEYDDMSFAYKYIDTT